MAYAHVLLSDENWEFILDSLNDRLENLTDINLGDHEMQGMLTDDIRHCESIMKAIQNRSK